MSWFVAVVTAHGHRTVERQLALLGYPAFYPRLKRWVTHARTKVAAEKPLLGRYLFVEINDGEFGRVAAIDKLRSFLLNAEGAPAAIDEQVVWWWRSRYMRGEFDLTTRDIPIGALVRITEGEFAEQLAIVTGVHRGKILVRPRGSSKVTTMQFRLVSAA